MKVLLVHNFYGSEAPSGENKVFEAEKSLLERHGHTVKIFTRNSDEIRSQGLAGMIKGAASVPWNPWSGAAIRKLADKFQPDVVHAHNTFPLISPSIFHSLGHKVAKVLTLHNYRLLCSAGIPSRDGEICTECIDTHSVRPAMKYGCYRGSRLATLPLAGNIALHRRIGTWQTQVDAFIALSDFQRDLMVKGGLPADKLYVKPNFYAGLPEVKAWHERGDYVVFVGRLSQEKGVETLLKAWALWGNSAPELRIVGDGPLREQLEAQSSGLPVRFLGQVSAGDAEAQIAFAKLLVLPSECFEGFPMVVREAFAYGTPVSVSNLGPLPSIVHHGKNGVLFEPGNPESQRSAICSSWCERGLLERLALGARQSFVEVYNEEANYQTLMDIYREAMERSRSTYP